MDNIKNISTATITCIDCLNIFRHRYPKTFYTKLLSVG